MPRNSAASETPQIGMAFIPDPKIQETRRCQNRNIVKRRHLQKVPIARNQTIRFSHQRRLEQLVIIRIATSELRASDRNPFRDRFELSQIDRSDFPANVSVELRTMETASKLLERLVGKQQHTVLRPHRIHNRAGRPVRAAARPGEAPR